MAGDISSELEIIPSAASFHLKALAHVGLVSVIQEGRHQRYRANLDLMRSLTDWLGDACCGGRHEACWPKQRPNQRPTRFRR